MCNKFAIIAVMAGIAVCFLAGAVFAEEVPDVISMESEGYTEHGEGIVQFTHKKHSEAYAEKAPELYKDGCGACHHDADNKPLKNLKAGDPVEKCIECHSKPGEVPRDVKKEWRSKKIKRAEQQKLSREWHAEAIHDNCRGCHRDYNRKTKSKAAPTTCTKCHPRTK